MSQISDFVDEITEAVNNLELRDSANTIVPAGEAVPRIVDELKSVRAQGKTIFVIGNGGSSAIAAHTACDLIGCGVRANALLASPSLTAAANDRGYENVFSSQLSVLGGEGDLLLAVSSSGRSANILAAVRTMRQVGGRVLTLSGMDVGNPLFSSGDLNLHVPSYRYGTIELAHQLICHAATDALKLILGIYNR